MEKTVFVIVEEMGEIRLNRNAVRIPYTADDILREFDRMTCRESTIVETFDTREAAVAALHDRRKNRKTNYPAWAVTTLAHGVAFPYLWCRIYSVEERRYEIDNAGDETILDITTLDYLAKSYTPEVDGND